MAGVFINYRTRDEEWPAVLIDRELSSYFGADLVFRAGRSIRPGDDFPKAIFASLRNSDAIIVVIGPRWATITDGRQPLVDERDWVRRELAEAFARNLPVVPILVDDASMPTESELPKEIAPLARLQYLRMRSRDPQRDLDRLVERIARLAPELAAFDPLTQWAADDPQQALEEVTIYTSSDDGESLRDAVLGVLEVCGFDTVDQAYPVLGSWFQRLFVRQRDSQAMERLSQLADKVERAAELKYINAPRSENDEREANAIARLAEAMSAMDEVVIRTSSVLFIKTEGKVLACVLTEDEIRLLKDNPLLMKSPLQILDALPRLRRDTLDRQQPIDTPEGTIPPLPPPAG